MICQALNDIPFYLLPVNQQKDLLFSLKRMQRGTLLTIGPLKPLNYEIATYVSLYCCNLSKNKILSFFLFVCRFSNV